MSLLGVIIRDRSEKSCEQKNGLCPGWIADHIGDYMDPLLRHAELVVAAVVCGFVIAFMLALLAHRYHWVTGPVLAITGAVYTIPSIALIGILTVPLGFGFLTALIPLAAYTLLILFRNILAGFENVPRETIDAARGMGMTDKQLLWQVELPLAAPEIFAGVRIAATTTVGLAALAFIAGAGGLGQQILTDLSFKSNIVVAGGLCVLLAFAIEAVLLLAERIATPWRRAG